MAKYSRLRERLLAEGIMSAGDLHEAPPAALDDLQLVHTREYVQLREPVQPQLMRTRARHRAGKALAGGAVEKNS